MESVAPESRPADAPLALSAFEFDLPAELIAQVPADRREDARLLALDRRGAGLTHTHVSALPDLLRPGDVLVVNDTRVIPARVFGRTASGAAVELLLVRPAQPDGGDDSFDSHTTEGSGGWHCLGKPARRLRGGVEIRCAGGQRAVIAAVHGAGRYTVRFDDAAAVPAFLERHGELPLPPYIRRPDGPLPLDHSRYQTVFAAVPGAIAAPTAGLHFTHALLAAARARGVEVAALTLHVGPGTFLPVRAADVRRHVMEAERCDIPAATAAAVARTRAAGGRVVAVGTTTTRALESRAAADGSLRCGSGWADRFIVPGHRFRVVDALLTNFHLPGSTLLLLVSALAGRERILQAYAEAIRCRYRFYSYGDAMLIQ